MGWILDYTDSRQWNKYSTQKSPAITLTQGQQYYVEVLQKEGGGGDNLAVGWAKPGQSTSAPSEVIPGSVLSPFNESTGPEINVLGSGVVVIDGDTSPSASDHTDFGSMNVSNGTVTRTFTIQNLGMASLTVNSIALSGANAADFSVIVQPASLVASGGNTTFQVRFDPSAAGTRTATLSVGNNDSNEDPYDFALQGMGTTAGTITREVWTGISGGAVANIPVGTAPNITDTLPSFEAPTNWADNYGTRLRGYITAPTTGSYMFWMASDDNSELWLSTNNDPANKVKICSVLDYTDSRQWNKYSTQKSSAITLTQGQQYYVEVLQKEGGGGDNLAVGWAKPGESTSAPSELIPGSVLSPFSQ
jgi:large repetitive protein